MRYRRAAVPAFLLILAILIYVAIKVELVPGFNAVAGKLQSFLGNYGLPAILLISFVENLTGVSMYFPGSIVILVSMAATGGNPKLAWMTFLAIYSGAMLSYTANYMLGLGAARRITKTKNVSDSPYVENKSSRRNLLWIIVSFAHPHFAGLTCFRFGFDGVSISRFLLTIGVIGTAWNAFWGGLMYNYGALMGRGESDWLMILMLLYFTIWLANELSLARKPLSVAAPGGNKAASVDSRVS